jgi:hypothetical protein
MRDSKYLQRDNSEASKRRIGLSGPILDELVSTRGYHSSSRLIYFTRPMLFSGEVRSSLVGMDTILHTVVAAWEQWIVDGQSNSSTSRKVPVSTPKMAASQTHTASNTFEVVGVRKVA